MKRNARILVAHDFSSGSSRALDYGIEFAVENGAELHFLHVEVLHDGGNIPNHPNKTKAQLLREELRSDILKSLDKQGFEYNELSAIQYTVLREIAAAPAIISYCKKYKIDLVVMGTHGRRGMSRKIMGSVAEEVVRLAPCTVFTVREQLEFESLAESLNTIAVPFDFSDHSRYALAYAKEMADSFGATLDIVHVIEEKLHPAFYGPSISSIYDLEPDIEKKILQELKQIYSSMEGPRVEASFTVLSGHPVKELVKWTETKGHNLLVIATHGLSGFERVVLGSVTERVVRQAPCPVITVKDKQLFKTPYSTFTETAGMHTS